MTRWLLICCLAAPLWAQQARTLVIDVAEEQGPAKPVVGFLGGLRDSTPDELLRPLNVGLFRIGHHFRGRIAGGLNGAIDRVQGLGAQYKLVMSDLINSKPTDWPTYEAAVKKLVESVGPRAKTIIWEPVNEPDISHKPIETYYDLYAHACRAVRAVEPEAAVCGPGYAFPNYDRYRAFLEACRERGVECNYLAWHYTGWDVRHPYFAKWGMERLPELIAAFPEQKIREIHCDEWGAAADKPTPEQPGRLQPGLAVLWFQCLEQVYRVNQACRANWGKLDDYLGGIVDEKHQPHPSYQVYRLYGQQKGLTRVAVAGNLPQLAALAARDKDHLEVLLGTAEARVVTLVVTLEHVPWPAANVEVKLVPTTDIQGVLTADALPTVKPVTQRTGDRIDLVLRNVSANQAYAISVKPAQVNH